MTWLVALVCGIGLGLLSFGGLWLTVRQLTRPRRYRIPLVVSQVGRLVLLAVGFYAVCQAGPGAVVCGLAGLVIAKWSLVLTLGWNRCHG